MVIMALVHLQQQGRGNGQWWHPQRKLKEKTVEMRWVTWLGLGLELEFELVSFIFSPR